MAAAQQGADAKQRAAYFEALAGKKIVFVPIAMGDPLMQGWDAALRIQSHDAGMEYELKDANWSTQSMSQAIAAAISEKPDVIVAHNINVQLLARDLKRANDEGIYVIQLNLASNQPTDALVGADWTGIAEATSNQIIADCGEGSGKSGKVAILAGQLTAADSVLMNQAMTRIFDGRDDIEIVASQATNWEAEKAREVTATLLQQHPDLCAVFAHWDGFAFGAGQAVKQAGKSGETLIYTNGGGDRRACDALGSGIFDRYWSYNSLAQGRDLVLAAKWLIQSGIKPGSQNIALYSPSTYMTPETYTDDQCWDVPDVSHLK
ncbi:sugar ABC transporter substrate-binding protein [Rhodobacteraceae bacterium KMM 6894]|nr:sugar ABC transporter substrate-binding protein [Rhodobacteraceae bacterium KMM 6894]